jgi:hypothetical protein
MKKDFAKDAAQTVLWTKIPRGARMAILHLPHGLAAAIAELVATESVNSAWRATRGRACAPRRIRPSIAETRIKAAIHRASPVGRAAKPWSGADEGTVVEPRGPVVPIRCAAIRRKGKVTVWADRRGTDIHAEANLRCCFGSRNGRHQNSRRSKCENSANHANHKPVFSSRRDRWGCHLPHCAARDLRPGAANLHETTRLNRARRVAELVWTPASVMEGDLEKDAARSRRQRT